MSTNVESSMVTGDSSNVVNNDTVVTITQSKTNETNTDDTANDVTNASFDLNMSSVSAHNWSLTPKAEEGSKEIN